MKHDNHDNRTAACSCDAWKYYEYGRAYNNSLNPNQYRLVETNTEFFAGNQWIHMPDNEATRRLAKPTFNIIRRVTSLFVASLTSSGTTVSFEPLLPDSPSDAEAAELATEEVRNLLEKFKMDFRIRDALFDGAITGDYCAHFYWDPEAKPYAMESACADYRGEIRMEMIDGIRVMFGNPNIPDVEKQPYILIVGRDTVERLKREAEFYFIPADADSGSGTVVPDSETEFDSGAGRGAEIRGDDDRSSKATYVYLYTKKRHPVRVRRSDGSVKTEMTETVFVTKATRTCTIFEEIDTGLSRYPIAWGNWQRQKNQYHGRALVTEVIPNQIFINQMMAMVFRHLQTQAFPTRLYNADLLPHLSNEVGAAIGVRNMLPGQTLGSVITTLPASDMSGQIIQAIQLCMQYTKECLGATDAQLGNLEANNTSAIMVLQKASDVPLENTRAGLHEWMEDVGAILLDMMGTYYGVRPIPKKQSGLQDYDFRRFKNLWCNIRVDAGATTYFSEIATVQTLDNLRKEGAIDLIDYLERIPDQLITRKQELIDRLKQKTDAVNGRNGSGTS